MTDIIKDRHPVTNELLASGLNVVSYDHAHLPCHCRLHNPMQHHLHLFIRAIYHTVMQSASDAIMHGLAIRCHCHGPPYFHPHPPPFVPVLVLLTTPRQPDKLMYH